MRHRRIGIDVGGSSVKGAVVDVSRGTVESLPIQYDTPSPSTPDSIARTVAEIVRQCDCSGPVGVTVPGVIKHGRVVRAANLDPMWTAVDAVTVFRHAMKGRPVVLLNDADAAGVAEVRHGAGQDEPGTVLVLTFGTGVGSALLAGDELLPNAEWGQLPLGAGVWQDVISEAARRALGHSWAKWAELTSEFLGIVEDVVWPDLIVVGGGISDDSSHWLPLLSTRARCVVAGTGNTAGIIGAAMATRAVTRTEELRSG